MKNLFLFPAICATLGWVGCNRAEPSSVSIADKANTREIAAASIPAPSESVPASANVAAAEKSTGTPDSPTTTASVAAAASTNYPDKEQYPHTISDASSTALIGGGSPQSGGEPIAASSSVIEGRTAEWHLAASDLQAELDRGTAIVRTKELGADAPADPADDEALHTLINNRLMADTETVRISTRIAATNGEVTLRGDVASAELIGRAIAITLDTRGVTKVTSEMKVDPLQPGMRRDDVARIPSGDRAGLEK